MNLDPNNRPESSWTWLVVILFILFVLSGVAGLIEMIC
jgi:hypothetical protein